MKIAHRSNDRLVITHRPWLLLVLTSVLGASAMLGAIVGGEDLQTLWKRLFVFALGAMVAGFAWRYMPLVTLDFDRTGGYLSRQDHRITGTTSTRYPLAAISRALYQSNYSENTRLERLAIEIDGERIPLEHAYGSGKRTPFVTAINDWLGVSA